MHASAIDSGGLLLHVLYAPAPERNSLSSLTSGQGIEPARKPEVSRSVNAGSSDGPRQQSCILTRLQRPSDAQDRPVRQPSGSEIWIRKSRHLLLA
jgi:hypothetical protein